MNRYNIFEDFGPFPSTAQTPLAIILVHAWPVAIGTVTLFYCGEHYYGLPFSYFMPG
jgi:pheromone a factor receptor